MYKAHDKTLHSLFFFLTDCKASAMYKVRDVLNLPLLHLTTSPYLGALCMNSSNWKGR